jgi:hypothetical protein
MSQKQPPNRWFRCLDLVSAVSENSSSFQRTPISEKFEFVFAARVSRVSSGAGVNSFDVVFDATRLSTRREHEWRYPDTSAQRISASDAEVLEFKTNRNVRMEVTKT